MKKPDLLTLSIMVLPMLAVMIAGMPDSVAAFELTADGMASGEPMYCSYFTLIDGVSTAVCLPFAGILGGIGFGLAVIYLVTLKEKMLKGVIGCCFAAMTLAVTPVLVKVDTFLLPNMMVPILLGINCVLANIRLKTPHNKEKMEQVPRLKKK